MALGGTTPPGRKIGPAGRPAPASGARASRLQRRRSPLPLTIQAARPRAAFPPSLPWIQRAARGLSRRRPRGESGGAGPLSPPSSVQLTRPRPSSRHAAQRSSLRSGIAPRPRCRARLCRRPRCGSRPGRPLRHRPAATRRPLRRRRRQKEVDLCSSSFRSSRASSSIISESFFIFVKMCVSRPRPSLRCEQQASGAHAHAHRQRPARAKRTWYALRLYMLTYSRAARQLSSARTNPNERRRGRSGEASLGGPLSQRQCKPTFPNLLLLVFFLFVLLALGA